MDLKNFSEAIWLPGPSVSILPGFIPNTVSMDPSQRISIITGCLMILYTVMWVLLIKARVSSLAYAGDSDKKASQGTMT